MTECPICGLPAEVQQRFNVRHGPDAGDRVVLVCLQRHWVTVFARELEEES